MNDTNPPQHWETGPWHVVVDAESDTLIVFTVMPTVGPSGEEPTQSHALFTGSADANGVIQITAFYPISHLGLTNGLVWADRYEQMIRTVCNLGLKKFDGQELYR